VLLAVIAFIASLPALVLAAYLIRHRQWSGLKSLCVFFAFAAALNAALYFSIWTYVSRSVCDIMDNSAIAANGKGAAATAKIEACTFVGTVENYWIELEVHPRWLFWRSKTLIDYAPRGNQIPLLNWIDDETLSIELGEVSWVSPRIDQVGHVHIIYSYDLIASPNFREDQGNSSVKVR